MKEKTIQSSEIIDLSSRQEGHFYDRKAKEIDGKKIQKIACAFANADGGDFIVGIKDDKDESSPSNRWSGFKSKEEFNFVFQNLMEIRPSIPYVATFLQSVIDNTYSLQITVEKSEKVHNTADNTVYIRVSAQSLPIKDPQKIQELSFAKGETSYEDLVYRDATAEDIFESKEIKRFLLDYSPQSDPIDFTVNQNLVDRNSYEPKMSGLLLFNDNPVAILPRKCGIKITRYDTAEKTPEREHLKEQVNIEGSLYEQIHNASETITSLMSNVKIWTPKGLDTVKYPEETIWEILVNAVIHRDYSISDDVHILIFNNRIEINSPGKLPGYVTEENILESRYSRNTKIVRTLNRYRNPPNKDMGEGLNTAFQKMKDWRLKEPILKVDGNYVKVTIAHSPIASPEETIIEFLNNSEKVKNRQARELTGIKSENKMKAIFYKLRDQGLIKPVMSRNGTTVVAWTKA
ncbi:MULTISPECIES: ATP-binding protein [Sphingobacterium]|uniref:ATP-binding protein n=1 Tax=Sphingobacterium TaxID=28453 RepID=UPI000EBD0862|nr:MULTISPECIES: ATP-binding protein [Sphingobacterium]HAF33021.1 transcriptional regulator [Sphingobacterium sp.]